MRKTKILVTLGPAAEEEHVLRELIDAGMNVARLNFSHGDYEEHGRRIERIKRLRRDMQRPVALLLDTKGPEIRTGPVENDSVTLEVGEPIVLTTEPVLGRSTRLSISLPDLPARVKPGMTILLDDGLLQLQVAEILDENEIGCWIQVGGTMRGKRSVNIPHVDLPMTNPTEKDLADLRFAAANDFDFVAVSFTETPDTINHVKEVLSAAGGSTIKVIAKIENYTGLRNFRAILEAADGIMVARGDLGVELPPEEVPVAQKEMIRACYLAGKPVITATQMLHSMTFSPRPTRAEVSDVANAIYDSTSAVMLSGETSVGKHPITCVDVMSRIALRSEQAIDYRREFFNNSNHMAPATDTTFAVTNAAITTAYNIGARAVVTVSETGLSARMLSRLRPDIPIIAVVGDEKVYNQLAMNWGVVPVLAPKFRNLEELYVKSVQLASATGLLQPGDDVVLVAGIPVGCSGSTNMIKVERVPGVRSGAGTPTQASNVIAFPVPPSSPDADALREVAARG